MAKNMKPIETMFQCYLFRSRLEARWAVFFEALGLEWEYEPEGFELGDGVRYLPDFRVTSPQGLTAWYEVKPESVGQCDKFAWFSEAVELDSDGADASVMLSGDPATALRRLATVSLGEESASVCPRCGLMGVMRTALVGAVDYHCHSCDVDTPGGASPLERTSRRVRGAPIYVRPHKGAIETTPEMSRLWEQEVSRAAHEARSARFEHGQRPRRYR